jgi:hypothetical protein
LKYQCVVCKAAEIAVLVAQEEMLSRTSASLSCQGWIFSIERISALCLGDLGNERLKREYDG